MSKFDINENFYEDKEVKKFLPKFKDEQVKYTGVPLTNHMLICGGTGSGKSNSFLNFLKRTSQGKGTYTKIFMLIKKMEAFNYYLKEKLGDLIEFYFTLEDFPSVEKFADLSKKNNNFYLIVFDDFITETKSKNIKKLEDYLIFGRSKGCQVILLSQSYYDTHLLLRKQVSFVLLCGIKNNRDLRGIMNEYSMGKKVTYVEMINMYEFAKEPHHNGEPCFLKIETNICPQNKKFSKNWLEYLNPDDFKTVSNH